MDVSLFQFLREIYNSSVREWGHNPSGCQGVAGVTDLPWDMAHTTVRNWGMKRKKPFLLKLRFGVGEQNWEEKCRLVQGNVYILARKKLFPLNCPVSPVILPGKCRAKARSRAKERNTWKDAACGVFECCGEEVEAEHEQDMLPASPYEKEKSQGVLLSLTVRLPVTPWLSNLSFP